MTRVLITGGTGFIGSWTAAALVAGGAEVRILDLAPSPGTLDFVAPGLAGRVEVVAGDLAAEGVAERAVEGCDALVHLAGLMTVDCAADPLRAIAVNLSASQRLIQAAVNAGARDFAYASTGGVYGPGDSRHPRPMTVYGTLKLALEGLARVAFADHGLSSTGIRPYIVYGPGESSGTAAGPSIALRAAAEGRPATIRFSGDVGFVHVSDVARMLAAAVTGAGSGAAVFDMGGVPASVEDFVAALERQVPDAEITVEGPPLRMPSALQGGDSAGWFDALPVTGLEDGIAATLAHWRRHAAAATLHAAAQPGVPA